MKRETVFFGTSAVSALALLGGGARLGWMAADKSEDALRAYPEIGIEPSEISNNMTELFGAVSGAVVGTVVGHLVINALARKILRIHQ